MQVTVQFTITGDTEKAYKEWLVNSQTDLNHIINGTATNTTDPNIEFEEGLKADFQEFCYQILGRTFPETNDEVTIVVLSRD